MTVGKGTANTNLSDADVRALTLQSFKHEAEFKRLPQWEGSAVEMRRSFTAWLLKQRPVALGSGGYTYSNAGYCVAAAMMEEVTGISWEDMIRKELFESLEIDGRHNWPASGESEQPWGHWVQNGHIQAHDPHDDYRLPPIIVPAGDVNMSIIDYGKWLQMLLLGMKGKDTLIKPSTTRFLLFGNMDFSSYSLGWGNLRRNNLTYCIHNGSAGTFFCHAVLIKELDLAVALMANSATQETIQGISSLRQKIVTIHKKNR